MKQTPQMQRIQAGMRPGALTREGFLGTDTRSLADILEADGAAVARLGISHAAVAARMRQLAAAGGAGLGEFITVENGRYEVRVESVRGGLPCPFGDPGMHAKTNITVRNTAGGGEVTFTDLNIHLIEAHGFYEGRGNGFRQEPAELAAVLGITGTDGITR